MKPTLQELLRTYTLTVQPVDEEDGGGFVARYQELGFSVRGVGDTPALAVADLEELALEGFEDLPSSEMPRAVGGAPWVEQSGRVTLRLPKMLHAKVSRQAGQQGVSLNQWICQILESATTAVEAGCEFGAAGKAPQAVLNDIGRLREVIDEWSMFATVACPPGILEARKRPESKVEYRQEFSVA